MNNIGYIYKTTNLINGKIYIGKRQVNKFNPNYFGSGKYIGRAINKHGLIHFKVELIAYATNKKEINELEKFYISESRRLLNPNNVYNIMDGGEGGNAIEVHKPNCQCAACKAKRGEYKGANHPMYGKYHNQNTIDKLSKSNTGKKRTQESKDKQSETMLNKFLKHKPYCLCCFCKAKRGEYRGENSPMSKKNRVARTLIF